MSKPRPEVVLGDSTAWQHFDTLPDISTPSANPNNRTTQALHGESDLERSAQVIASIGGIWNSKQPNAMAKKHNLEPKFIYTAQEMRNRQLASKIGFDLPSRNEANRLALHHATGKVETIWHDIAEIAGKRDDLTNYQTSLRKYAPEISSEINNCVELIGHQLYRNDHTYSLRRTTDKKRATDVATVRLAYVLSCIDELYKNGKERQNATQKRNRKKRKQQQKPQDSQNSQLWCELVPKVHKLNEAHRGRQTPKKIASNIGQNPSRIANYYTDPQRRVFTRKIRDTGALVIVDTSGSMSLSSHDLDQIMLASRGATVVAYSDSSEKENCHLIASRGKRVRELPSTGGNNGVDVPAIEWAIKNYHKNNRQQILLISDGKATGLGGSNHLCREELRKSITKNKIHIEQNIFIAIEKLKKLGKTKLKTNPEEVPL